MHRREIVLECFLSLDTAIRDFADLVAVELRPLGSIIFIEEVYDEDGIDEVDECVSHIAVILEINRQVEEVIVVLLRTVNCLQEHLLSVLVRNVLDHDGRSVIKAIQDVLDVQRELQLSHSLLI